MVKWKGNSETAYLEGDRQWMDAMDRLSKARDEWQKDIGDEITRGIEEWRKKDGELEKNIESSRDDLLAYLEAVKGQWESHSTALTEIALTGAGAYAQAMENISWLDGMIDRYGATGSYSGMESWTRTSTAPSGGTLKIFGGMSFATSGDGRNGSLLNTQEEKKQVDAFINEFKSSCRSGIPSEYWNSIRPNSVTITATLHSMTYDPNLDKAFETYSVTIKGQGALTYTDYDGASGTSFSITRDLNYSKTLTWKVESDSSPFCFYSREKHRWESMVNDLLSLVGESEDYIHNRNMLGTGGPGFLRNVLGEYGLNPEGSESDPYLMTESELEYELALREKSYWERRLSIAEAVMMYASPADYGDDNPYAPGGVREDAAVTEKRKEGALADMTAAKAAYELSHGEITSIVEAMAVIKGVQGDGEYERSIEYLSSLMEEKRGAMESAREEYARYREAVIVLENGQGFDFLKTGLAEAQKALGELDSKLWELRKDYNFPLSRGRPG